MANKIPDHVLIWQLGGREGNLQSQNEFSGNNGYRLFCTRNEKYLIWKKQPTGINLDWSSDKKIWKTHFHLPGKEVRDILTGEVFALGIGGGDAFLKYEERIDGINLVWSKDPVFEWKLYGETDEQGKAIAPHTQLAIANINVKPSPDFLVYYDRLIPGCADIGWPTSPLYWTQAGKDYEARLKKINF